MNAPKDFRIAPPRCTGKFRDECVESDQWIAEPKLDGGRYILHLDLESDPVTLTPRTHLFSRRDFPRIDKAANVPHITARAYPGLRGTVLDGEILHPDASQLGQTTGIMNCAPAKAIERQKYGGKLQLNVFDMPVLKGVDIRHLPLAQRRELLEVVIKGMANPDVVLVPQTTRKAELFDAMLAAGKEGTVLKNLGAAYGVDWVKCKRVADFSVIVSGFKPGKGKNLNGLGAVAVSVYQNGELREVGFVSGMTDAIREQIWAERDSWLGRVIDVSAQEVTRDGRLRHGRWLRERDDIDPQTLTFDKLITDADLARRAA